MRQAISISEAVRGGLQFVGTRYTARELRARLETLLTSNKEVVLDFTGMKVSQSFADELIGLAVLRFGPGVLERMVFKGCSDSVQAIIEFVVADRYDEYVRTRSH